MGGCRSSRENLWDKARLEWRVGVGGGHYSKYLLLLEFPRVIVESLPHRSFILLSSFSIITRFLAHNVSSQKAHSFLEMLDSMLSRPRR